MQSGPDGLGGGDAGQPGKFLVNGEAVNPRAKLAMQPGDKVVMETPGGGGFGKAG